MVDWLFVLAGSKTRSFRALPLDGFLGTWPAVGGRGREKPYCFPQISRRSTRSVALQGCLNLVSTEPPVAEETTSHRLSAVNRAPIEADYGRMLAKYYCALLAEWLGSN